MSSFDTRTLWTPLNCCGPRPSSSSDANRGSPGLGSAEDLIRLRVQGDVRRAIDIGRVGVPLALSGVTDLQNELSRLRKLEDLVVLADAAAREPDEAPGVDGNPVLRLGPFVSFAWRRSPAA